MSSSSPARPASAPRTRVVDLAKEFGVQSAYLVSFLDQLGMPGKLPWSPLDDRDVELVKAALAAAAIEEPEPCRCDRALPAAIAEITLARTVMRLEPRHAALVLLQPLTDEEKRNNTNLAGMSVINLPDLDGFLRATRSAAAAAC